MKKICFVATIAKTLQSFVLPLLEYLSEHTDWEITVICDDDPDIRQWLPEKVRYIPVRMKRGISPSGIARTAAQQNAVDSLCILAPMCCRRV